MDVAHACASPGRETLHRILTFDRHFAFHAPPGRTRFGLLGRP